MPTKTAFGNPKQQLLDHECTKQSTLPQNGRGQACASDSGLAVAIGRSQRPGEHQLTPGLLSSLPRTAGSPPFIFFSTSYPELDSAERRYEPDHAARCARVRSLGADASS